MMVSSRARWSRVSVVTPGWTTDFTSERIFLQTEEVSESSDWSEEVSESS